ncbi:unnamed protein product [Lasius platythorax]|uniref:Uncharacterized protein n=1 Tax=Lasius platythorax TaxID=488582 RepID=A0AAV2NLI2_9HYME
MLHFRPHLIFYRTNSTALEMLFPGGVVPDICCSLSSSPQQGICIIIISPRPSRKLELHVSHPPCTSVSELVSEKGRRMELLPPTSITGDMTSYWGKTKSNNSGPY